MVSSREAGDDVEVSQIHRTLGAAGQHHEERIQHGRGAQREQGIDQGVQRPGLPCLSADL